MQQGELALEIQEAARIREMLAEMGIQLIPPGIFVGHGGCGIRLGKAPAEATADKSPQTVKGPRRKSQRRKRKIA